MVGLAKARPNNVYNTCIMQACNKLLFTGTANYMGGSRLLITILGMQSMPTLGGLGHAPRKIRKITTSESILIVYNPLYRYTIKFSSCIISAYMHVTHRDYSYSILCAVAIHKF